MRELMKWDYDDCVYNGKVIMVDMYNLGLRDGQVVIFVDVLGFKQAILRNESTTMDSKGSLIVNLPAIYNNIDRIDYTKEYQLRKGFKFLWVSDSIVFSTEISNIDIVLSELCKIINIFYCSSFALRGAITVGKLYHEENIWGPAFVWAVEYEKKAMFPRIVIKKHDLNQLKISDNYLEFFKDTEDPDFQYFDYFDYHISTAKRNLKNISASLNIYSDFINDNLKNAKDDKTIGKYMWLANSLKANIIKHSSFIDNMEENYNHCNLIQRLFNGII
jgi:hypothetical protein